MNIQAINSTNRNQTPNFGWRRVNAKDGFDVLQISTNMASLRDKLGFLVYIRGGETPSLSIQNLFKKVTGCDCYDVFDSSGKRIKITDDIILNKKYKKVFLDAKRKFDKKLRQILSKKGASPLDQHDQHDLNEAARLSGFCETIDQKIISQTPKEPLTRSEIIEELNRQSTIFQNAEIRKDAIDRRAGLAVAISGNKFIKSHKG